MYRRGCLIAIQKTARMYLAKKKYKHRYRGIIKMNSLKVRVSHIRRTLKITVYLPLIAQNATLRTQKFIFSLVLVRDSVEK